MSKIPGIYLRKHTSTVASVASVALLHLLHCCICCTVASVGLLHLLHLLHIHQFCMRSVALLHLLHLLHKVSRTATDFATQESKRAETKRGFNCLQKLISKTIIIAITRENYML